MTMTLPNLVGVQSATARAHERADPCAFLATRQATNGSASQRSAADRQLVTMLLPE